MPVYTYEERWDARPASTDTKAGQSLQRAFWVVSDTPTVSGASIIAALAVLEGVYKGAPHPEYTLARCTKVEARPNEEEAGRWDVVATYEEPAPVPGTIPEIDPETGQQGGQAPEDRPARIRISSRREDEYRLEDLDEKPFLNTAKDPFASTPPFPRRVPVITIEDSLSAWNVALSEAYYDKVNSDVWGGFEPGQLLIVSMDAEPVTEGGWSFWKRTTVIEVNRKGWNPVRVLDAGFNYIDSAGRKQAFTDDYGQASSTPGLLNGVNGNKLLEGNDPEYCEFRMFVEISFSTLG